MGDYKLMSWCYEVAGIGGGSVTRPVPCPADSDQCAPLAPSSELHTFYRLMSASPFVGWRSLCCSVFCSSLSSEPAQFCRLMSV